jgi:ribose transport system substrate-binding protein
MKKVFLWLLVVSMIAVFSLAGGPAKAAAEEEISVVQLDLPKGEGTIYYLLPELLGPVQVSFEEQNKQHGEELGYKVKSLNANNQTSEQIRQLDDAIAQNPKAIILNAVDAATVTASVDKARENGIRVLVLDRFITDTKTDFTSALGTVRMGEMGAEECKRLLEKKYGEAKGVILEVMGDTGDNYSVTIHQGFESIISKYPNIESVTKDTPGWETTATINIVNDQLTKRNDIDVIFIHWDGRVPWIFPVLEEKGYSKGDIKIVGTDGTPEALQLIRDGWLESTVNTPIQSEVYGNWIFMDEVLSNEEIIPGKYNILGVECELINEKWGPTLYIPGSITTKDNVDDPSLWGNFKPSKE